MIGLAQIHEVEIRHFHLCCGLGGAARGFDCGRPEVGNLRGRFRCIGGVDTDAAALRDFERRAGAPGTLLDLFDREQYRAFHGCEPPADWCEATPDDLRRAAGGERPHIVFASFPCKGFSGLLSESKSRSEKYQALNRLALRGVWLAMEAWGDDPPELFIMENVPRIATRGRYLLDQIGALLDCYDYARAETTYDCGEIGELAQSRKRFLLVARHKAKVPPFLYTPPRRPLRAVGEILGRMPLPGDPRGGPMHAVPRLQWKTWIRLAFVEAGSDWRSLNKLRVVDGRLADYLIVPELRNGMLGVNAWNAPGSTVTSRGRPNNGTFAVADPRFEGADYHTYGVRQWNQPSETITGKAAPGAGAFSVSDPRIPDSPVRQNGIYRVVQWNGPAGAITGAGHVAGAAMSVADPRPPAGPTFGKYAVTAWHGPAGTVIGGDDSGAYAVADPRAPEGFGGGGKYRVTPFDEPTNTVIAESGTGNGAFAVADPRVMDRKPGDNYLTGGHYGVVPWDGTSGAVSAAACHDNGRWSVADPRISAIPAPNDKLVAIIRALDGTWHRPFTTLELAAIQSLVDPEELFDGPFDLDGSSDSAKRERIGNAVPPRAAGAIANEMGRTLLLAWSGETFMLSDTPVWVRPVAVALSVRMPT